MLTPIFVETYQKMTCPIAKPVLKDDVSSNNKIAILHFDYNKCDTKRNQARKIWDDPCQLFEKDGSDGGLVIQRMICA